MHFNFYIFFSLFLSIFLFLLFIIISLISFTIIIIRRQDLKVTNKNKSQGRQEIIWWAKWASPVIAIIIHRTLKIFSCFQKEEEKIVQKCFNSQILIHYLMFIQFFISFFIHFPLHPNSLIIQFYPLFVFPCCSYLFHYSIHYHYYCIYFSVKTLYLDKNVESMVFNALHNCRQVIRKTLLTFLWRSVHTIPNHITITKWKKSQSQSVNDHSITISRS